MFLSAFLRLYKPDQIPVSLYWDETAIAYNAYSIVQTGKDEYGVLYPILFRSFNDYKLPGSVYVTAFFVKIFGLNEFSARIGSALFGVLTVFMTFFLVKELLLLLEKTKNKSFSWNTSGIGLLSAFLLGISPWHLQFSRAGFEANMSLFFIVFGTWAFLKGIYLYRFYFLALTSFAISFYFYRSIFIFVPLFLLGLSIIFWKYLPSKKFFIGSIFLLLLLSPLLPRFFSPEGMKRLKQVDFTSGLQNQIYKNSLQTTAQGNSLWSRIVYNRRVVYIQEFMKNYFSHFTPSFLFLNGDSNGRHGPRGMGLLYYWEIFFILFGLYVLLTSIPSNKFKAVILLWLFLAPIPASLSVPTPHALRSLNMLPMPQILISLGLWFCYRKLTDWKRFCFTAGVSILVLGCFINYLYLYYDKSAKLTASDWADGYKQAATYAFANEKNFDKVIMTGYNWQPYIYFLFYKNYDPYAYQKTGSNKQFDKYIFGGTSWDKEQYSQTLENVNLEEFAKSNNVLVVLSPEEFTIQKEHIQKLTEIKNHNNELVFIIGKLL